MPDTKIFIDTNEEITFLVEKIKQAATQNVVVIVPDRASIFITSASLRLLKKSIDRLDKKVILVTMDEAGKKMADTLDFVTVYRVRDVTSDIWQNVKKYTPVKKGANKKNSVISRELPKDYNEEDLKNDEENLLQENKDQEEQIDNSLDEAVLPNLPEEKFEFPHAKVEEENLVEEVTNEDLDVLNNPVDSEIESKNVENVLSDANDSFDTSEIVDNNYNSSSVLKSDEELSLTEDEEKEMIQNTKDSEPEVLDIHKKFVVPNFTKRNEVNEVHEVPEDKTQIVESDDEDDDLIFFEGEDVALKNLKKKSLNFHLKTK